MTCGEMRTYDPVMGNLLKMGKFTLHSGMESDIKIDADVLTDEDIEVAAYIASKWVRPFGLIRSIPTGGDRFARAMEKYKSDNDQVLIVDDVYTTGSSMNEARKSHEERGLVIFARSLLPVWCDAVFHMQVVLRGGTR